MIRGIHHTSFTVSNLEEAENFFVELIGMRRIGGGRYDFEYIGRMVGSPDAHLEIAVLAYEPQGEGSDRQILELVEYKHPRGDPTDTEFNRPGNAHLCFLVDDIEAEYERLRSNGVCFRSPPQEITYGINKGGRAVYFNGPDGVGLELLQRPGERD